MVGEGEGNGNTENDRMNAAAVMEVEVLLEPEHIDYLIRSGFLLEEDAEDSHAIGVAVGAWLDSLKDK